MKLKYLAKEYAEKEYSYETEPHEYFIAKDTFIVGFKSAFKTINESLTKEINRLEQYPMMNERIFALKLYMKKMDDILRESEND